MTDTGIRFEWNGYKCKLVKGTYQNKRAALVVIDEADGEVLTKASVNIDSVPLDAKQVLLKGYSENEGLPEVLVEAKAVKPTGRWVENNFVQIEIYDLLV